MLIGEVDIAVKVQGKGAIVRKTVKDRDGQFLAKYGLGDDGEWIAVAEGERYPVKCILPVTRMERRVRRGGCCNVKDTD